MPKLVPPLALVAIGEEDVVPGMGVFVNALAGSLHCQELSGVA